MGNNYHSRDTYSYIDTDIIILPNKTIIKFVSTLHNFTGTLSEPFLLKHIRGGEIQQLIPYAETRRMFKIFHRRRTESDRAANANGGKMLGIMRQKARSDGLTVVGYGNKKGATPLRELRLYAYRLMLSALGSRQRANVCVD